MSKGIRAVVVDDEPLARDELTFLLGELDVEVVGEASNAKTALDFLAGPPLVKAATGEEISA
ncbi:MAG: hypothetical protein AAGE52_22045, partial [Myxococcota bacterium]